MKFFQFCLLGILLIGSPVLAKKHIVYVGTYTKGVTNGIFAYSFDDHSGKMVDLKIPTVIENPSFITISANKKYLYAVSEVDNRDEKHSGGIFAFQIEKNGSLRLLNQLETMGANPCHVSLSPDGKMLVVSNYSGGNFSLFNVFPNGSLSMPVQTIQHTGKGFIAARQSEPHVHSAKFDAKGTHLYVADLGIDELKEYQVKKGEKPLTPNVQPFVKFAPGSGPRHFEISADGSYIYVMNELSSTISVLMKYGSVWKEVQSIKTIPKDYTGENSCADIHLSADGRFVYGSNRGHNSIVVFTREKVSGKLELIQTIATEGEWPRNFAIDPSSRFLLVANQRSNDITLFKLDDDTGKLRFSGIKVKIDSPVCLQFLK